MNIKQSLIKTDLQLELASKQKNAPGQGVFIKIFRIQRIKINILMAFYDKVPFYAFAVISNA